MHKKVPCESIGAGNIAGRRGVIVGALSLGLSAFFSSAAAIAHTPYGQWDIFRQRHLQVLTSRSDLIGDALAETWVAILAEHLPKSHAVVSRARDFVRVASLLKTDQAKLAVLSYEQADAMFGASTPFEDFAPMPLQVLIDNGSYVLLARDDLPLEHGYLLVVALLEQAGSLNVTVPMMGKFGMALHPGARAAALGEEMKHELQGKQ